LDVNDACGGLFVVVGGATTIDHVTPRGLAGAVDVAARPPAEPGASGPLSAMAAATRPPPVPTDWLRSVTVGGSTQPLLAELRSAQYDTSLLPAVATGTEGVVRTV